MSVLVLGAEGMLGRDLVATAPHGVLTAAVSRREVDITDEAAVRGALDRFRPAWVMNAAAFTEVDRAETEYGTALDVNGTAVGNLGRLCADRGIGVLHFGTDYIFPGDGATPYAEADETSPVNAYGRSKLAGEQGLLESGAKALVLRTQWLFGIAGRSFPRTMSERAARDAETRVVDDQMGRPTSTVDLATASWTLLHRQATGIYHVANSGTATWFDVAKAVFDAYGSRNVRRCRTEDYPTPARRPAFSVLDTTKVEQEFGLRLPAWQESLARFLEAVGKA